MQELYFWRDYSQRKIDLLIQDGINIKAVEMKSGKTIQSDFFNGLSYFQKIAPHSSSQLVYGGTEFQARTAATVYPIGDLYKL